MGSDWPPHQMERSSSSFARDSRQRGAAHRAAPRENISLWIK